MAPPNQNIGTDCYSKIVVTCDRGGQKIPTNLTKLFTPLKRPGKSIVDNIFVKPFASPPLLFELLLPSCLNINQYMKKTLKW